MSSLYTIWVINFVINIAALLVHALGMYAISIYENKNNQTLILFNLSVAEFLFVSRNAVNNMHRIVKYHKGIPANPESLRKVFNNIHPKIFEEVNSVCYLSCAVELVLIMTVMTFDRLICALKPFKYIVYMTVRAVRGVIIASWILSVSLGVVYAIFPILKFPLILIFCAIGWMYLILAAVTYFIIAMKIGSSARRFSTVKTQLQCRVALKFKKHYMVPGLIILTFAVLYGIPYHVIKFGIDRSEITKFELILNASMVTIMDIGLISDALIYIFLTPHFREIIVGRFAMRRNTINKEVLDTPRETLQTYRHGERRAAVDNAFVMPYERRRASPDVENPKLKVYRYTVL